MNTLIVDAVDTCKENYVQSCTPAPKTLLPDYVPPLRETLAATGFDATPMVWVVGIVVVLMVVGFIMIGVSHHRSK